VHLRLHLRYPHCHPLPQQPAFFPPLARQSAAPRAQSCTGRGVGLLPHPAARPAARTAPVLPSGCARAGKPVSLHQRTWGSGPAARARWQRAQWGGLPGGRPAAAAPETGGERHAGQRPGGRWRRDSLLQGAHPWGAQCVWGGKRSSSCLYCLPILRWQGVSLRLVIMPKWPERW
jgi:hypothetical protein